jgi:hypothetical protein
MSAAFKKIYGEQTEFFGMEILSVTHCPYKIGKAGNFQSLGYYESVVAK